MKTLNVLFCFRKHRIVADNAQDVIDWINSIDLVCNEYTADNITRIFNNEWKAWGYKDCNLSPVNAAGYPFNSLKTTNCGNSEIRFYKTKFKSVEEVELFEKEMYETKQEIAEKISASAEVFKKNNSDVACNISYSTNYGWDYEGGEGANHICVEWSRFFDYICGNGWMFGQTRHFEFANDDDKIYGFLETAKIDGIKLRTGVICQER